MTTTAIIITATAIIILTLIATACVVLHKIAQAMLDDSNRNDLD